ncbi:hypothetical protein ACFVVU_03685 [Kitasatospora sp. NPDC057965]|uniref:hypothetical protein n=1 Tax=Kitasatospora sp. NPDC057965 TaxID=3346291 RepID=UPI0036D9FF5F
MTTTDPAVSITALAVGIHRDRHCQRLLLRLSDGHRAVSLPLAHRDIDRIPVLPPTVRTLHSIVRWLTPPLAVRIRTAPGGRGIVFTGLAEPAVDRRRPGGAS